MYTPKAFQQNDAEQQYQFLRDNPMATLVVPFGSRVEAAPISTD